jgi:hypothetical protein
MRWKTIAAGAMMLGGVAWMVTPSVSSASSVHGGNEHGGFPRYQHIVEIMMENTSFSTIIGNPLAPNLNAWLASTDWPRTTLA